MADPSDPARPSDHHGAPRPERAPVVEKSPVVRPGAIGEVVRLHGLYYAANWRFGPRFEADVAAGLGAFVARMDPQRDLFLTAWIGDIFAGSVTLDHTIVGHEGTNEARARLRWFVVSDAARGTGLGRRLIGEALEFADAHHYSLVWLTTFAGLDAARHLYESHGFRLVAETGDDTWHGGVGEQRFERG